MTDATTPIADEKPLNKAGVFLYGWVKHGNGRARLQMVAPYTEGRFGNDDKYYSLSKGSIDEGETALAAARRETHEETGIDIKALLGDKAYQRLSAGESLTNLEVAGYPGVRVLHANAIPTEHTYVSGYGAHHKVAYYAIEVEGIEHLRDHLKRFRSHDVDTGPKVRKTVMEHIKIQDLPNFDKRLAMLRSPLWTTNEPVLHALEAEFNQGKPINTPEEWFKFCDTIPGKKHKALQADMERLKQYLKENGVIGDTGRKLKLDTKDRPLFFYQEGADILPIKTVLERSRHMAVLNPLYARAMWGEYIGKRRPDADKETRMESAQIAPLIDLYAQLIANQVGAVVNKPSASMDPAPHPDKGRQSKWVGRIRPSTAEPAAREIPPFLLKPVVTGAKR